MANNAVYIPSIDGKDLYISNHYRNPDDCGYTLHTKSGEINRRKFINTLDYSLDLIKLREVYEKVYRRRNFTFRIGEDEFTTRIINVTAHYAVKEYNRVRRKVKKSDRSEASPDHYDLYVKNGWRVEEVQSRITDCVYFENGELIAIQTGLPVHSVVSEEMLGKFFYSENNVYFAKSNITTVKTVAEIREGLYENGFVCDGVRYIRFKRSAGSSRVGKCLFIDERLYDMMHKWQMCGIKIQEGQEIDLAALESYIALTSSSIIDTIEIQPQNILVIDDYESSFEDDVIATRVQEDGHLVSAPERVTIKNSIWDGQSLMDKSLFGPYQDHGMLLLRNRFFKSCCFNANIQQFFADHGITRVDQVTGFTLAKRIEDIKLITTPSSIKYLKFGRLREWLRRTDPMFGVVKYEKKTHFFGGRMVSTHYQLLNTLQMTQEQVDAFLSPSIGYVTQLKTNPAVMRFHLSYPDGISCLKSPLLSKNDIVFRLLGINDRFAQTKLYADFRDNLIRSYINNIRRGHVLVNGNYSTLLGNPLSMLLATIQKFDGTPEIKPGNIMSTRFPAGKRILGSRSPHVCQGNILLATNVHSAEIARYLNMTEEIVCINSIGENILQRLSGCDFDSDTMMLTDDPILVQAAEKNYDLFRVPTSLVESKKTRRCYTSREKSDLDIKTSVNKIGEIINLSQELNSLFWDRFNRGASFDQIQEIYHDVAMLDVMSGIEIDKAKKEFTVDNAAEYRRLKEKYERRDSKGRVIKPNFFGIVARKKGYYDNKKKSYQFHQTTMDFVQHTMNKLKLNVGFPAPKPFSYVVDPILAHSKGAWYPQVDRIIQAARNCASEIAQIHSTADMDSETKYRLSQSIKDEFTNYVSNFQCNTSTMYVLLKMLDRDDMSDIRQTLFTLLFGTANSSFYSMIEESREPIEIAVECLTGEIVLYGRVYTAHPMH